MHLMWIVVLSGLFVVTHIGLSHGTIRSGLVETLGEWPFRGLYSVVSVVTLGGAAVVFWGHRHVGPALWVFPRWAVLVLSLPLMFLALELLVLLLGSPSPVGMLPARAEPRAVLRITRHPMNMAFSCFALAHLAGNGALGDVSFFGSIFVVGFVGAYHQDRRVARERGAQFRAFQRETSVFPFAAVLSGRTRLEAGELSLPLLVIGVVVFGALAVFHGRLFGVDLF